MGIKVILPPEVEPVSLAEAKAHLRLSTDTDDAYVSALTTAARERVELYLRRSLITQTLEYTIDRFPACEIDIPRPPLQAVEWIKYFDTAGILRILPAEDYVADLSSSEIARMAPAWNCLWPATRSSFNSVVIRFTAGYGDSAGDVPQAIRHGILMEISNLYENREDIVVGQAVALIPVSERLLWPYRALTPA